MAPRNRSVPLKPSKSRQALSLTHPNALADWLATCGVDTVAMESTGVCWIVLFALLDARGFKVLLVNARHVQHMQKTLTQMSIQLANVISDVVGETGQKILRAIVDGERDGHVLAAMKNVRIRASSDEIAKSLEGNWRAEHLFALKQALALFDSYATQLAECDREIEAQQAHVLTHGQTQGRDRRRPQARTTDLHHADQGRGAHRPRAGVL